MALKRPPCGRTSETSLLDDVALEPNRPREGVLDASLFVFVVPPKRLPVELAFAV